MILVGPCFGVGGRKLTIFMGINNGGKNPNIGGKYWLTLLYFEMVKGHNPYFKRVGPDFHRGNWYILVDPCFGARGMKLAAFM
jgi:hypothetical protein